MKSRKIWGAVALCVSFALGGAARATPEAGSFPDWINAFRKDAIAAGVSGPTFDFAFAGVELNPAVKRANERQPEFSKAIWDYLDGAVSQTRIEKGRVLLAEHKDLFDAIEADYGVEAETIVAIWGLESAFGAVMGDYNVIEALATLAFDGRRTAYGRSQLIGALKILENGYATKTDLMGSWAGAMGQTQFIPTTYLTYAVDRNGDAKRDLWRSLDDIFASTANYLQASGWRTGEPWGFEVVLPEGFDYAEADRRRTKTASEWAQLGVTQPGGTPLTDKAAADAAASIIAPGGANGPAFLILQNFRAILKYNNSTAYALAIGRLSDSIAGAGGPLAASWPREERPLSRSERIALQEALISRGYAPGAADGVIGANTRKALRAWQKDHGFVPDGFATASILEKIAKGE